MKPLFSDSPHIPVAGVVAPPPRLTVLGAALAALLIAIPGGGVVWLISLLFRLVSSDV